MSFLYNFGLSQEDERTEAAALQLCPTDRVLSIASAGDMPLSLLAIGAERVDAVDVDPAQLHLARLKLAAVQSLDRRHAVAFLGFLPAAPEKRLAWLHRSLPALPEGSRRFWLQNKPAAQAGAIWVGRYERYVGTLVRIALRLIGRKRFEDLLACTTLEQQREVFDRHFDRKPLRMMFEIAFHPKVFSSRGMDPRSLQYRESKVSLGRQYFEHFRNLCTATPTKDNHLLQLTLLGRVRDEDTVPTYLSASGYEVVRERSDALHFFEKDLITYLEDLEPRGFDKAHLSNLPDWLDQQAFDRVVRLLSDKGTPNGRFVWRYIHINRPIPKDLEDRLHTDLERGRSLRTTDRFPFYGVVCGHIVGGEEEAKTETRFRIQEQETTHKSIPSREVPGFEFRVLGTDQGDAMTAINRACPIEADFTLIFERDPNFFRWPDIIYDRYQYVGIHRDDRLIGYCMTGEISGWTGACHGRYFYGGDARILRSYRGHRLAEKGLQYALELLSPDVEIGFGLVKQGNKPAQRTVDTGYSERFIEARRVPFEAVNILLLHRLSPPRLEARRARPEDMDDMVALFDRANGKRLFAPSMDTETLEKTLRLPGLSLDRWYVVTRGSHLVGMAAAWDQHEFHRTRVLQYSPMGRAIRMAYGASRQVLQNAAPLPEEGGSFRSITLSRLAVADSDPIILRSLLHKIVNDHLGRGYHMLHVGFAGDDPLQKATKRMFCQRFRSEILIGARRDVPPKDVWYKGLPYVDLAII